MVLTTKHRYKHYRKYEVDIWGLCQTDYRVGIIRKYGYKVKSAGWGVEDFFKVVKSKLLRFFYNIHKKNSFSKNFKRRRYIYRLDIVMPHRYKRQFNLRFTSVRITRLYFLTLQDYQFRKLFKRASKMDGI